MTNAPDIPKHVAMSVAAMGTRFELMFLGDDTTFLRAVGDEAIDAIRQWEQRLSIFRPDSVATRLNRFAAYEPIAVEPDVLTLLKMCKDVSSQSNGAFDLTVAPLMRELGFHNTEASQSTVDVRNNDTKLLPLGMDHIVLDEQRSAVSFAHAGIAIDFGAVGKGVALDEVAAILDEHGIENAVVHGGTSTVLARGAPPDRSAWGIGLQDPALASDAPPTAVIELSNAALSVSAHHGRTLAVQGGSNSGHVIDPRTGRSASADMKFAACIADSAAIADAWSTALLVLGERPATMDGGTTSVLPGEGVLRVVGDHHQCVGPGASR